ncbi:histidine phosphatase family protein [Erythrobacter sp. HL-111]|uniref:histidine phosphatase family protein n=1 Tax=Erythrobacter sp. HL-111 TaxID=1798193 RepID=UPI0006DBD6F7|nr:histidine phosphatase family protein [Erythrobacter sp. HL-111]KPP92618.1 MAG: putative phosphoglycerate mutase GpmB [Erythrobacteraceae bacterium HL-111]SDS94667.1 probable phosphoglycerate mutase [Erythrobacter sp. HL-111]
MRLLLVRHGKPETPGGSRAGNPPLSAEGHAQARGLRDFLKHEGIEGIVHSGMTRAADTARPTVEALGLEPVVIEALGEVDRYGGDYANPEMVRARGQAEWTRFLGDPLGYFGIDQDRFVAETLDGFGALFEAYHRRTIAIFTHGFPINILLAHALGLPGIAHFVPGYGSISRVSGRALDRLTVVSINETAHLAPAFARERAR